MPGISITGVLEPSCKLVDKLVTIQGTGQIRYIQWEELTRRDTEILGVKTEEFWKTDSAGVLRKFEESVEAPADTSTELRLKQALTRRGIALEMARLLSFKIHETLVDRYFRELDKGSVPGYHAVTVQQVHNADTEAFVQMAEMTESGLPLGADGSFPLDTVIPQILRSERFSQLLNPKQRSESSGHSSANKRGPPPNNEMDKLREKIRRLESSGNNKQDLNKTGGKAHGKGKKSKPKPGRIPKELIGLSSSAKAERVCYAYNLEGCPNTSGKCPRGAHVCMRCGGSHSQRSCPKA